MRLICFSSGLTTGRFRLTLYEVNHGIVGEVVFLLPTAASTSIPKDETRKYNRDDVFYRRRSRVQPSDVQHVDQVQEQELHASDISLV